MSDTWVVVADSNKARFFSVANRLVPLHEFADMACPGGRLPEQAEVSDRQGGIAGGQGEGGHAFEGRTDLKQHEAEVFARQIAEKLEQGRIQHQYQKLILVAAPAFLGALRTALNEHVAAMVVGSLDKNLVTEEEAAIREHIF